MSASLGVPSNCLSGSAIAENQIQEIFSQHWEKIKHHMMTTRNQIDAWRQRFIDEINKYANEQIRILDEDYARRNVSFNETFQENLEITRAYCSAQNIELFNELQNACRLLEFQVAQVENVMGTMPFLKVITVEEQIERKKKEHFDALKAEDSKSEEKSMIESTDRIQYNQSANGNESRNSASSISNERQPHSSMAQSSVTNNQSIGNNGDSHACSINEDNSISKCPICFMIFPLSMTQNDRSQHVNEHGTYD